MAHRSGSLGWLRVLPLTAALWPFAAGACSSTSDTPAGSDAGASSGGDAAAGGDGSAGESDAATSDDATPGAKTHNVAATASFTYSPKTLRIKVGEKVVWKWTGGTHTVTSGQNCTPDGVFDSEVWPGPHTFERVFDATGTFDYFCDYKDHCQKGQVGQIIVEP